MLRPGNVNQRGAAPDEPPAQAELGMEHLVDLRYDTSRFIRNDYPVGVHPSNALVPAKSTFMIPFAQRGHGADGPKRERW